MPEQIYLFFCATAYGVGYIIYFTLAYKSGQSSQKILLIFGMATFSSLLGAKIFHTLFEAAGHLLPDGKLAEGVLDLIQADPWHWARLFNNGHVFLGALIGASLCISMLAVTDRLDRPWSTADCFAPAIALGLAVGRVGCFFTGCCFGRHVEIGSLLVSMPTQLLESGFGLICFFWLLAKSQRPHREGGLFINFLTSYCLFRFFIEFLRADEDRGLWFRDSLSTSQLISAFILLTLSLFYWIELDRRVRVKLS